MNCFNHTEQPAVAQCSNCGRFLCKECSMKYKPILCDECGDEFIQAQQVQEQNKEISDKNRFIIAIALFAVNFCIYFFGSIAVGNMTSDTFLYIIVSSFAWAGIPYGWQKLNMLRDKLNFILILPIIGWLFYFGIKFALAMCIGWFFFIKKFLSLKK